MDVNEEEIVVYVILEEMYMEMLLLCAMVMAFYAAGQRYTERNMLSETSMSPTSSATPKSQQTTRKRQRSTDSMNDNMKELGSMFRGCFEIAGKRIEQLAQLVGQAKDLSTDRRKVPDELRKMEHLTLKDRIFVAKKIVERPEFVDLFFSCTADDRQEFVANLLQEGP